MRMWKGINTHSSDRRWRNDRKLMIIYGNCEKKTSDGGGNVQMIQLNNQYLRFKKYITL